MLSKSRGTLRSHNRDWIDPKVGSWFPEGKLEFINKSKNKCIGSSYEGAAGWQWGVYVPSGVPTVQRVPCEITITTWQSLLPCSGKRGK